MRALGIKIVDDATRKHTCMDVRVLAVMEDEDGAVTEVDISSAVKAVHPRLVVGEIATAQLEVFITGLEARCDVEEVLARYLPRRKLPLWRRIIEVTTFSSRSGAREVVSR